MSRALGWPRMVHLLSLPPGWNSYDAPPVSHSAAERALNILAALLDEDGPMPEVVPTNDGGLQLEWHELQVDLEIRIGSNGGASVFLEDIPAGIEVDDELSATTDQVKAALRRIAMRRSFTPTTDRKVGAWLAAVRNRGPAPQPKP